MTKIETFYQATMRFLFILISLPTFTLAGVQLDNTLQIDSEYVLKLVSLFIISIAGGVSSSFIKTSFDESMKSPAISKILIGAFLGTTSGLLMVEQFNLGFFSTLLPVFVVASLAAPIMVFYLSWFSNKETQEEIKAKIKERMGVDK